ncbi:ROK family protein [Pedobacter sp.]|jgi:glucokinase|uniref:ROK family protein n=1 Tax=Pedobacter sp. TaxID=1411316 RepID=UPI002CBAD69C|nr:ROK family protein [Pedobacter sp.]HWW40399.1 ROK family protein [Pedobacter sp.]
MLKHSLIGVDLGGTNVRCGLVQDQEIQKIVSRKIPSTGTEQEVVHEIVLSLEEIMSENVVAIGIGVPGILDTKEGIVYDVQNIPSWKAVPLKDILEQHFKLPVYINNDANCFVAGEWYYGSGKDCPNLAGLILGTGVAAGLICNNKLYEGRNCGAGEFGMLPYLNHNFEFYCSGNFFSHFYQRNGEELFTLAQEGNPEALDIFNTYGKHVAAVVKAMLYAIDPQKIILGGSVSKAYPFFKNALWNGLQDFAYQPVLQHIQIQPTGLENIAVLGAAALYHHQLTIMN